MDDIARLQIRIESLEAANAEKRLGELEKTARRTEKATDGLTAGFGRMLAPLAGVVSATAALSKLVNVTREFEVLNAQLITATGSSQDAAVAFDAIQQFAAETPYDLQQVTTAFTKLVNMGLTPSERALTSYGDTASAMGKSMNDMIEAVADAATGEFERLKEFGIRASKEGDQVKFTFRGVTETVAFESGKIEEYLIKLGENNFAGNMAERMKTLDGALANLGDEWDAVFRNIADQGVGDFMEEQVRAATSALQELNAMLASGELVGYLDAASIKLQGYASDIEASIAIISGWIKQVKMGDGDIGSAILDGIKNLPENVRFFIQAMVIELAAGFDKTIAYAESFIDRVKAVFSEDTQGAVSARLEAELAGINSAREDSIQLAADERQAAISSSEAQIAAAKQLRAEYDAVQNAKKAADIGDSLARFRQNGSDGQAPGQSDKDKKEEAKRKKAFEKLQQDLQTEEQEIQSSYDRRLAIILANTEENSEKRSELIKRLNEKFKEDALGDLAEPDTYQEQLDQLNEFYEKRKELILANTQMTEEERTKLEEELTKQRNERVELMEAQRNQAILGGAASLFESLADISKNFAGEQSSTYKTLFAISKAFAVAESIIKIQQGIANAASLGFPANIGAMATVAASTANIISTIKGTQLQGQAHAGMTNIPSEGTWNLAGGERVVAPEQNRDLTKFLERAEGSNVVTGNFGGGRMQFSIQVINNTNQQVQAQAQMTDEGQLQIILDAVDSKLSNDMQNGRGIWDQGVKRYGWGTRNQY